MVTVIGSIAGILILLLYVGGIILSITMLVETFIMFNNIKQIRKLQEEQNENIESILNIIVRKDDM